MNEQGADPGEQLTRMFTDLANDPDAPPSTVTAESVLAAARGAESGLEDAGAITEAAAAASGEADPSQVVQPERDELAARRARRRRSGLTALVVAAAVAAIAAVVIPLTLSSDSSTTTSAGESETVRAFAAPPEQASGAVADSAAQPPAAATLAGPRVPGVTTPAMSSEQAAVADADAAGSAASGIAPASACWPALPDAALNALLAALPPERFGSPAPLTTGCVPDPVGAAVLPGLAGSEVPTAITVQVQKAQPGACRRVAAAAEQCAPTADGVYLQSGAAGPSAFVYGGGNQVLVGGSTTASGAPIGTGLTAQQLAAAARAVLAAV